VSLDRTFHLDRIIRKASGVPQSFDELLKRHARPAEPKKLEAYPTVKKAKSWFEINLEEFKSSFADPEPIVNVHYMMGPGGTLPVLTDREIERVTFKASNSAEIEVELKSWDRMLGRGSLFELWLDLDHSPLKFSLPSPFGFWAGSPARGLYRAMVTFENPPSLTFRAQVLEIVR
jgi:hypothetical protein